MRRYIKYKILGLAIMLVSMIACTAEQDVEPIVSPEGYPVVTFTPREAYSVVNEGDTLFYDISIDKMLDRSLTFDGRIVGGTSDDDDIVITPGVIQPYSTTTSVMIIIPDDWDIESDETLQLELGVFGIADRYLLDPNTVNAVLNATIKNYVSDLLTVSMSWDVEVGVKEIVEKSVDVGYDLYYLDTIDVVVSGADEIDWDVYITPAEGFDIEDPWFNDPVAAAETGDHPEVMELDILDLEDGDYVVWGFLYANGIASYYALEDSTAILPITTTFEIQGARYQEVVQDSSQSIFGYTTGYSPAATRNWVFRIGAYLNVTAGKYTISDYDGNETGPWKRASNPAVVPSVIKSKRIN